MSSKRVSKKSSRHADYFEHEEINCKRKKKDDGDDDEFDDDMNLEPKDLADVLKKKTMKQKPKIDCKRKKKDGDDCNRYRDFDCVIYVIVTFNQYLFVFLLYPCELPV